MTLCGVYVYVNYNLSYVDANASSHPTVNLRNTKCREAPGLLAGLGRKRRDIRTQFLRIPDWGVT